MVTNKRGHILVMVLSLLTLWGTLANPAGQGRSKQANAADSHAAILQRVHTNPVDGAEMVFIPAGKFDMGTDINEIEAQLKRFGLWDLPGTDEVRHCLDEVPKHSVTLPGFWMYKYEVTCRQYQKFIAATGRPAPPNWPGGKLQPGMENYPVTCVTWVDAMAYARWGEVRLAAEQEWEKAAGGADGRLFVWGNDWDPARCNSVERNAGKPLRSFKDANAWARKMFDEGIPATRWLLPVGSIKQDVSPYGCYDMAGNVSEWTASPYEAYPYPAGKAKLIICPEFFMGLRVVKGGCALSPVVACRVTERDFPPTKPEEFMDEFVGFRCAAYETAMPKPGK